MRVTILGAGDAFASRGNCQAGYLIEAGDKRILLEAGPALLPTLKRGGFDSAAINLALISHLHGDHFAGLPFLILEYLWERKRRTTLTIAGPRRLEQRTWALFETMFPKSPAERVARKLKFVALDPNETRSFNGVKVSTIRTPHTTGDISLAFRVAFGGKTVVFSGDTGWTEELVPFCAGADLFICECTYFDSAALDFHLNYPLIEKHRSRFKVQRMILSHLGREVYEHRSEIGIELASDGMQIEI